MPFLSRHEIAIHYETYGTGTPLLFFSETACAGDIWNTFQVPEFSGDHLVITHDYRGTGKSTKPTVQYTCDDFVDDAVAILDHLNASPAILLGHSMGGRVAMLMAIKFPHKVKKLIVASVGPGVPGAPPIPFKMCKEMVERGYEKYVREHTLEVGWTGEYVRKHAERVEYFLTIRMNNLPTLEDYLRHVVARQACDLSEQVREIKHPALVLVGDQDHGSATGVSHRMTSEALAKELPNGRFAVIPNEAHNYFMTNPDEAHRIIRNFLASS
ncbi:MAG TPA: alpha/beta hydrolase [Candidatus Limnocylindrales bacterium]|nr:alpha/beta hydrolase [Candidatus Limnocylindrales bacterium]